MKITNLRHRIDFLRNDTDLLARNLGMTGFSGKCLAKETGLSRGQVYARLKKAGVRLWDFRNGHTEWSRLVINNIRRAQQKRLASMTITLKPLLLAERKNGK